MNKHSDCFERFIRVFLGAIFSGLVFWLAAYPLAHDLQCKMNNKAMTKKPASVEVSQNYETSGVGVVCEFLPYLDRLSIFFLIVVWGSDICFTKCVSALTKLVTTKCCKIKND